ncbi:MAG: GNAT family N-acetyltransferase [Armatimonadota bacterium]
MIAATDRLDRYWAEELGCSPEALYADGVTLCAPSHRDEPRWMGWLVPFECVALASAESGAGVVSITPSLMNSLQAYLQNCPQTGHCLPPNGRALMDFLRTHLPNSYPKIHRILRCSERTFKPYREVWPVSELHPEDIHASWYRLHFDGPIFVTRNERGSIAAWAAIKVKSDDVWEMAVVTEAPYRGRGLAKSVVSRATEAALEAGKVPLYLHEITNYASSRVCTALGYQYYGDELVCEDGRILPSRG